MKNVLEKPDVEVSVLVNPNREIVEFLFLQGV